MHDWTGWIETVLESALLTMAFVMVYDGARRVALLGLSRWPALMLAVGLLVPVVEAGASLKVQDAVASQSIKQSSMHANEPPGGWEKAAMSAEERTTLSTNAAQINFMLSGKRGQVIDPAGNRVPFRPTDQDLQDREGLMLEQKGAEDTGQQFLERGVRLFTNAFVFMAIGFIVGRLQRRKA